MTSKLSCVTCENKDIAGVFKCEGCSQRFCLKHTNEHRDWLNEQLDEIYFEHKNLLNTFSEHKQHSSLLVDQINKWENDSIIKIQQTAQQARIQIRELDDSQKNNTSKRLHQLTKQLDKARGNDEYLEKDLYKWILMLEQLKYDFTNLSSSIVLYQDSNQTLIHKIFISQVNQQSVLDEKLISYSDQIQMDDNYHLAMHCGPYRNPAYISGTKEYSSGQHRIRLFISKKTDDFVLSFNIMSQLMNMPPSLGSSEYLVYGWQSDDCINPSRLGLANEKNIHDFKGNIQFQIELFIDCDNQKISYFNERTKRTREMKVNMEKCPLPWKLYFYLYDVGDCVRLLSSS